MGKTRNTWKHLICSALDGEDCELSPAVFTLAGSICVTVTECTAVWPVGFVYLK
jgi:hypothetical protein